MRKLTLHIPRFATMALLSFLTAQSARADEVDFARDIQPIFAEHCFACHGPDEQEAGFRLDQRESATAEAESGEAPIAPGDFSASELLRRLTDSDPDSRMPPEGDRVSPTDIDKIKHWIQAGAEYTEHWAYRPLVRSTVPPASDSAPNDWYQNPIDYFVAAKLDERKVAPSPIAHPTTLVKRLYYDLIGIPPTIATVDAFVEASKRTPRRAYEALVDDLLASPRFGERWGRHWLDKARFADSDGYEKDNVRKDAWHYRDWVIRAINNDLPFDKFTVEQLAGDLLPKATAEQRIATAFNRQTLTNTEGGTDREQWRIAAVMDRMETLGTVWLGLTVGCARCHTHKYDQISHDEYYQLFAFFNNGDETDFEQRSMLFKKTKIRVISQRLKDPRETRVLRRGEFLEPLHPVTTQTLGTLPAYVSRNGDTAQGDRLDLARWLVDGQNPLPPRVAANHVWKNLFGKGLVRTTNDFGIRGEPPTHPKLLDWLATELIDKDWSRKQLIRTIVLSSTYQQASAHRPELVELDPNNRLLHRQNRFRVEAEVIRDITLGASGLLSTRVGGPSVFPPIPASVTALTYNSGFKWNTSTRDDRYRRGMYTFFKRTAPHPNLTTFDCPTSNVTCVERESSNTPIAALVTLNNQVYIEAAVAFAKQTLSHRKTSGEEASEEERIEFLLRRCISREPLQSEIDRIIRLVQRAKQYYEHHESEAGELVGTSEQHDVSELAAWTTATRVVLNLDEFITRE